jgi:hypothetical protein
VADDAYKWFGEHGFSHDTSFSYVENAALEEANELFVNSKLAVGGAA